MKRGLHMVLISILFCATTSLAYGQGPSGTNTQIQNLTTAAISDSLNLAYRAKDTITLKAIIQQLGVQRETLNRENGLYYFGQGYLALLNKRHPEAAAMFSKSTERFQEINLWRLAIKSLKNQGVALYRDQQPNRAIIKYEEAITIFDTKIAETNRQDSIELSNCLYNIVRAERRIDAFSPLFTHSLRAIKLAEAIGNTNDVIEYSVLLGVIYAKFDFISEAKHYRLKAAKLLEQSGRNSDKLIASRIRMKTATSYSEVKKHYEDALLLAKSIKYSDQQLAGLWYDYSLRLKEHGYLQEANFYSKKVIKALEKETPIKHNYIWSKVHNSAYLIEQNKAKTALEEISTIISFATETKDLQILIESLRQKSMAYAQINQPDSAYNSLKQMIFFQDSLERSSGIKDIVRTQLTYQFDQELKFLKLKQAQEENIALARISRQRYILIGILVFLLLLSGLIFSLYRSNKLQERAQLETIEKNNLLTLKNKKLNQFSKIISHDILSNIELILSYGNLISSNNQDNLSTFRSYQEATQNICKGIKTYCIELLNQSLTTKQIGEVTVTKVEEILNQLIQQYHFKLKELNFNITVSTLSDTTLPSALIHQLFQNIITNAIKYVPQEDVTPILIIRKEKNKTGQISWIIEDNGPGIPPERLKRIFLKKETFKATTNNTKLGLGIGIFELKQQLTQYDAELKIDKSDLGGIKYTVEIPTKHNINTKHIKKM